MAFILSSSTTVEGPFAGRLTSLNVSAASRVENLFQLTDGTSSPIYDTLITYQVTASLTLYAPGPTYSTEISINCEEGETISLKVVPGFCGEEVAGLTLEDDFYVNSYSYNKTTLTHGTESWGLISKTVFANSNFEPLFSTLMLTGAATGSSTDPSSETGVVFNTNTVETIAIDVSAGNPGLGQANKLLFGGVSQIGGGLGSGATDGKASVTIPYASLPGADA